MGVFFVFGLFHLAWLIFVLDIIIAWHCLLLATGMPWNSFYLELVSCIWGESIVAPAALESIATWISSLVKHVFTKGSFGPNASLLHPLSFPEVHTMTWKLMAKLYLTFWNLLCNSHMRSLELCEIKSFFHLFFQLGYVFINQSNSDCVWWKVKTKLIFLFYSSHIIFQTKLFLIIFKVYF